MIPESPAALDRLEMGSGVGASYPFEISGAGQTFDPDGTVFVRIVLGDLPNQIPITAKWTFGPGPPADYTVMAGPGTAWVVWFSYRRLASGIGKVEILSGGNVIASGEWLYLAAEPSGLAISAPARAQPGAQIGVAAHAVNAGAKGWMRVFLESDGALLAWAEAQAATGTEVRASADVRMPAAGASFVARAVASYWFHEEYREHQTAEAGVEVLPELALILDSAHGLALIGGETDPIGYRGALAARGAQGDGLEPGEQGKAVLLGELGPGWDEDSVRWDALDALELRLDAPLAIVEDGAVVSAGATSYSWRSSPGLGAGGPLHRSIRRMRAGIALRASGRPLARRLYQKP